VTGLSSHNSKPKAEHGQALSAVAVPATKGLIVDMRDLGLKYETEDVLQTGVYDGSDHYVLKDVNLKLEEGSFHFLTGPSGTGRPA